MKPEKPEKKSQEEEFPTILTQVTLSELCHA